MRASLRVTLCALLLLGTVTACTSTPNTDTQSGAATSAAGTTTTTPTAPVQPVIPTVTDQAPTRTPPATLVPVPAPGSVQVEAGAFTDRLAITELVLQPDQPTVTAHLQNIADVSGLIVLELRADFYDTEGAYLGFGTATYADEEFAGNGATPLPRGTGEHADAYLITVPSNTPLTGTSSAILTVPQLVNE